MHKTTLLLPLFVAACSFPRYTATRSVDLEVPLTTATRLACSSHNGDIRITTATDQPTDTIRVHADMTVRGHTQAEADANLDLVAVGHATDGDQLRIFGKFDRTDFRFATPTFSFQLRVPPSLALTLSSHNGDVETTGEGRTGPVRIETHNGRVLGAIASDSATIETHNGDIDVDLVPGASIAASLTTHNGDIDVAIPDDASAWVDARTHNGRIDPPSTLHDAVLDRHHARFRVGNEAASGRIELTTHNGDIDVRGPDRRVN